MLRDLDFKALRAQIEAVTRLPDFAVVDRRAGRVKLRERLAVTGALVGTLAVFVPMALAATLVPPNGRPAVIGPNPNGPDVLPGPLTDDRPSSVTVRAVAGALPDGLLAAVDVCVEIDDVQRCNLQISPLQAGILQQRAPVHVNTLRANPTDRLEQVQLTVIAPRTYLLSGVVNGREWKRLQFNETTSAPPVAPTAKLPLAAGDRVVQLQQYGELFGVHQVDSATSQLTNQPALTHKTIMTGIPPELGWWIAGADPQTGSPSVAVSRDLGLTWQERSLSIPAGVDVPTVVTYNGQLAYALVRSMQGLREFRSADGGLTWVEVPSVKVPDQATLQGALAEGEFGGVMLPDHSLLIWIADLTGTVFLHSSDGVEYDALAGPGGPVVAVTGGYASLGDHPALSLDGLNWAEADFATPVLPD